MASGHVAIKISNERKREEGGVNRSFRLHHWLLHSCKQNKECGLRLRYTLTSRPFEGSRKWCNRSIHLHWLPGPIEGSNQEDELKAVCTCWLPGQIEGNEEEQNRRVLLPESKRTFSLLYFVLSLHFLAIQYGCNSVGYLFYAFLLLYSNVSN